MKFLPSRHRIEPLLSVSYTANSALKTEVISVKILPDYTYYVSVIKPLAWSDPIHLQSCSRGIVLDTQ